MMEAVHNQGTKALTTCVAFCLFLPLSPRQSIHNSQHHRPAATSPEMQPTQAFRCRSSGKIVNIETFIDPKSGERIVLWKDVQRAFKNAESIWKGSCMLSFLKDEDFEE